MALRPKDLSEEEMLAAEALIPELAAKAGRRAYEQTLANTGSVVVVNRKGQMVKRSADGTTTVIKTLPPDKRVKVGLVLKRVNREAA